MDLSGEMEILCINVYVTRSRASRGIDDVLVRRDPVLEKKDARESRTRTVANQPAVLQRGEWVVND